MQLLTLKGRRSQTIERILTAAKMEFSEAGFAGARVDEIARRARVNKATIYYHIGGKQALYEQVVQHLSGTVFETLNQNVTSSQAPEEKLKQFIQTLAGIIDQHPELAAIVLREQASGGKHFPEILVQNLARILGLLTEILDDGIKAGVFKEAHPLIVHLMIIGTIVFFKMSSPIRAKFVPRLAAFQNINDSAGGDAPAEIQRLILNALKK
jgi:AcrR family transcriptional regulator